MSYPPSTSAEKIAYKHALLTFCKEQLQLRIDTARHHMNAAQQAANQEEKSSAGDKYETSRAMSHIDKDMHARQLAAHLLEWANLQETDTSVIYNTPVKGAVIDFGETSIFIAAGLGKQAFSGRTILFVSPNAPVAMQLYPKKEGDLFLLGKDKKTIHAIY